MKRNLEAFPLYPDASRFTIGPFQVIGSTDHASDGCWRHVSVSREDRYPNWDEIVNIRYQFFNEDVEVVMYLPPKREYINLHPNCFHLWQRLDRVELPGMVRSAVS